jgi:2-phosphoglycerate kinase
MKKLTLIGGAPLSGKTTLSRKLAKDRNAVELSTDSVRSWMQSLVSEDMYSDLFYASGMTAEEFYEIKDTPEKVVDGEVNEGKQVEKGIIAMLDSAITWDHLIIEGIALSPDFMNRLKTKYTDRDVEMIVLVDENKDRIHQRISTRGLWGPLDTYPGRLIPTEVEWVVLYNKWFLEQSIEYGVEPILV